MPNWLFLTGSLSQLTAVWHDYGIEVEDLPAGRDGRAQRPRLRDRAPTARCGRRSATTRAPARPRRTRRSPASSPTRCCRRWASHEARQPPGAARRAPRGVLAAAERWLGRRGASPRAVPSSPAVADVRVGDRRRRARRRSRWPPRSRRPRTAGRSCRCRPTPRSGRCSPGRRTRRTWKLVTPPGVADNGGLVASAGGANSLTVAVRPSQDLVFSPLAATANGGASWSAGGPINAAVAASPGALAAFGAKLVALLGNGAIEASTNAGATWSMIAKPGAIAASPAAKGCGGAVRVTTVSFGPTGDANVLAGGTCGTGGTAAMFSYSAGHGLAAGEPAGVRAARAADRRVGARARQVRAERAVARAARRYDRAAPPPGTCVRAPRRLPVSPAPSAGVRPAHRVGHAGRPAGRGCCFPADAPRRSAGRRREQRVRVALLPPVPAHTTVLAAGPDGAVDALAVSGATLTVWRLATEVDRVAEGPSDQRAAPVRLLQLGRVPHALHPGQLVV